MRQTISPLELLSRKGGCGAGADDDVVKPFDPEELVARIRALLRWSEAIESPLLPYGELLQLDPCTCDVSYAAQSLAYT